MPPIASTRSQSSSMVSHDDRLHILSKLPAEAKALGAAFARIYHAPFGQPTHWSYTGLQGFLVFGRDMLAVQSDNRLSTSQSIRIEPTYWFRLIDSITDKGVIWQHQIADGFEYDIDKPFFHIFAGKSRMFGFRFDEDSEAGSFYKKVTSKVATTGATRKIKKASLSTPPPSPRRRLLPSMISSPKPFTFVRVAHVGIDENGMVEAEAPCPLSSSNTMAHPASTVDFEELEDHGVDKQMLESNQEYVKSFLTAAKTLGPQEDAKHSQLRGTNNEKRRKAVFRRSTYLS